MSRRVAVVGAGLAGLSTAFELRQQGCAVTVFERAGSVAEQASFAGSACLLPPLPELPWASKLGGPAAWQWQRWHATRRQSRPQWAAPPWIAVNLRSQARLNELRRHWQIDDEPSSGLLVLLQDDKYRERLAPLLEGWRTQGLQAELVDAQAARRLEPGLNPEASLGGALSLGPAGTSNARLLSQALRIHGQRQGIEFRFHTTVRALTPGTGVTVLHEHTPPEAALRPARDAGDTVPAPLGPQQERFDAVVLCCGLESTTLLRPLGVRLPFAALHEATVTVPLRILEAHPELGPQGAVADLERHVQIARIGQRVRVSGERRVTAAKAASPTADFESLHRALQAWFPGSAQHQQVQHWQARRAWLPDGLPLVGAAGPAGVWLHVAPNTHGPGLSLGLAEHLAQCIAGQPVTLELGMLDASRLT